MAGLATEDIMALISGGNGKEERLFVEFDTQPVPNALKTVELGYSQFDDVLFVKIGVPGDGGNIIHRAATNCGQRNRCERQAPGCDFHRFPRQYAAFHGDLDQQAASGLPLGAWPAITKAEVAMLKAQRIHTVEQLAGVPDSALPNVGSVRGIRQKAIDFVESAKGLQPLQKLRAELESRDNKIATLEATITDLARKFDDMQASKSAAKQAGR